MDGGLRRKMQLYSSRLSVVPRISKKKRARKHHARTALGPSGHLSASLAAIFGAMSYCMYGGNHFLRKSPSDMHRFLDDEHRAWKISG